MRSPCKGCDNELEDKKKHPECRVCEKPIHYVDQVGRCPGSSVAMEVKKVEMETQNDAKQNYAAKIAGIDIPTVEKADEDNPIVKTKICSHPECPFEGKPQPLDEFDNNSNSKDGKAKYCKECRRRMQRLSRVKKRENKPVHKKTPETNKAAPKIKKNHDKVITIDFSGHPEIYNEMLKVADAQLRTPENQALFILKSIYEKGLERIKVEECLEFPNT